MVYNLRIKSFLSKKDLEHKNVQLEDLVKRDSMTGLFNHASSYDILSEEMKRATKLGQPLSVVLADLDDFKKVNDEFGHQAGDRVIVTVSETFQKLARKSDIVGRYGGEEFIVIMPGTSLADAECFFIRCQEALKKEMTGMECKVTLSAGICQYSERSLGELISETDNNLYTAKRTGKDKCVSTLA